MPVRFARHAVSRARSLAAGRMLTAVLGSVLVATTLGRPPAAAAGNAWLTRSQSLRIMAFGDSITAGVGMDGADIGDGGYRGELQRLLAARGYHYAMTGGRSDFSAGAPMRAHEGHPGYVLRSLATSPAPQLYGAVTKKALEAYDPDVILLMAGTNDLLRLTRHVPGYTLANIAQSMNVLLAQIFYEKPNVDVIVAGVVASPRIPACVIERFDGVRSPQCGEGEADNLRTLAARYAARGFHIVFVPGMDAAVPRDKLHFPDGIHPCGSGGYAAIARVWLQALEDATAGPGENVARTLP